jgi:UDPglucose 6-dehydrogenase
MKKTPTIGFIGQGFVGKNIADDFESREYTTVRYALEKPYHQNKDKIKDCDMVFIAVPTPTTPKGFDMSLIEELLPLVGEGKTAVIKSTITPGSTEALQKKFPERFVLFSPEFLSEASAAYDAANPFMALVGTPVDSAEHLKRAEEVLAVLPQCPHMHVVRSIEAEMVKYAHNCSGYVQIVFTNLLHDLATEMGADWSRIQSAIEADPYIPGRYARPVHKSGRGAGGHCFIKDFAALTHVFKEKVADEKGVAILHALEEKNAALLCDTEKDLDLLEGVYGKEYVHKHKA